MKEKSSAASKRFARPFHGKENSAWGTIKITAPSSDTLGGTIGGSLGPGQGNWLLDLHGSIGPPAETTRVSFHGWIAFMSALNTLRAANPRAEPSD